MSTTGDNKFEGASKEKSINACQGNTPIQKRSNSTKSRLIPFIGTTTAIVIEIFAGICFYVLGDDLQTWGYVNWGFLFHYLTLACGLFLSASVVYKRWPRRLPIIASLIACWILLAILYIGSSRMKPKINAIQQPQDLSRSQSEPFIEGTETTQKQLSDLFPFGYAVFFGGQNRILRNEIFKNGLMDWKLDLERVLIEPDFSAGIVKWTIPNVSATPDPGARNANGSNIIMNGPTVHLNDGTPGATISILTPLKMEAPRNAGFFLENRPVIHVAVLSTNQRSPVFVIGFRIPTE